MLTLYDYPFSGNAYKVRLALAALGIPHRIVVVDLLAGESRAPWFLAKAPVGQVPVLELDDGTCLSESTAILMYLAEGTALVPSDRLGRARVLQWMGFEQTHIDGVISRARFRRRFPDAIPTRPEQFAAWERQGHQALAVLDRHLDLHPYLVDDRFTVADIANFAYVHVAGDGGFDLDGYPAVRAWIARIEARPTHVPIG
ncbi:MAG: glutathione S-transferase family protein [Myxococcota bacterium]